MNGTLILYVLFMAVILFIVPLIHVLLTHRDGDTIWTDLDIASLKVDDDEEGCAFDWKGY